MLPRGRVMAASLMCNDRSLHLSTRVPRRARVRPAPNRLIVPTSRSRGHLLSRDRDNDDSTGNRFPRRGTSPRRNCVVYFKRSELRKTHQCKITEKISTKKAHFLSCVRMYSMQSAILFYHFCPSDADVVSINECTYRHNF